MKFLITESKLDNLIKNYLISSYDLYDVKFETKTVHLGSGPNDKGETTINQKAIIIYINNVNGDISYYNLRRLREEIRSNLENAFNIDFKSYGSEWDVIFYQIVSEPLL